jgi:transposase InsO family protein
MTSMDPKPEMVFSDNGGEFKGRAFTEIRRKHSVIAGHAKARTPQQNGKIGK